MAKHTMCMQVYDAIVNMVPTQNIPSLIESYAKRTGDKLSAIPCRTTVEQMARELDSLAVLKTAEMSMKMSNLTRIRCDNPGASSSE